MIFFKKHIFLLRDFENLRKGTISFVTSICLPARPSVCMEQLGFHWSDFNQI